MQIDAKTLSEILQGEIEGSADVLVSSPGRIEDAQEGQICFLANPKYEKYLYSTQASIVVINRELKLEKEVKATLIRVEDAYSAFAILLEKFGNHLDRKKGIHESVFVAPNARVSDMAFLAAFVSIGAKTTIAAGVQILSAAQIGENVEIGENSIIHPNVVIYDGCVIGKNVIIHAGSVIGSDGFGFAPQPDGSFKKIPQTGNVVIEDNVELGANLVIDRASVGSTRIKQGAKLDNLVQVAHNVEVGRHTVVAAQAGVSGSTKVGNFVKIGGQAGLVGHIQIADKVGINAQSGVSKSIEEEGAAVTGSPAQDFRTELRAESARRKVPGLLKKIEELEKRISDLEAKV